MNKPERERRAININEVREHLLVFNDRLNVIEDRLLRVQETVHSKFLQTQRDIKGLKTDVKELYLRVEKIEKIAQNQSTKIDELMILTKELKGTVQKFFVKLEQVKQDVEYLKKIIPKEIRSVKKIASNTENHSQSSYNNKVIQISSSNSKFFCMAVKVSFQKLKQLHQQYETYIESIIIKCYQLSVSFPDIIRVVSVFLNIFAGKNLSKMTFKTLQMQVIIRWVLKKLNVKTRLQSQQSINTYLEYLDMRILQKVLKEQTILDQVYQFLSAFGLKYRVMSSKRAQKTIQNCLIGLLVRGVQNSQIETVLIWSIAANAVNSLKCLDLLPKPNSIQFQELLMNESAKLDIVGFGIQRKIMNKSRKFIL